MYDTLRNFKIEYEELPGAPREKRTKNSNVASTTSHLHSNTNKQPVLGREYVRSAIRITGRLNKGGTHAEI